MSSDLEVWSFRSVYGFRVLCVGFRFCLWVVFASLVMLKFLCFLHFTGWYRDFFVGLYDCNMSLCGMPLQPLNSKPYQP